ncbi:protein CASP-like isoform X2 [Sesamum indicum]|uniref:Protein CASP-like isoform X2 n=1 Tax=Sesamum indicum TaxID=4182 RepID=A0A6I9UHT1_SESIN|nr:protein CASP-like isoform X2 [Sesamum indicum]
MEGSQGGGSEREKSNSSSSTTPVSAVATFWKDFKKASNEEKLVLFNSLLKGYQEEVDKLTKRAKFGENACLNIYQKLYEAPDPYPVLTSIAEDAKLSELESENRKMKVELEEFRTESTYLKNQQATIRRLEERTRQLEQQGLLQSQLQLANEESGHNKRYCSTFISCGEEFLIFNILCVSDC